MSQRVDPPLTPAEQLLLRLVSAAANPAQLQQELACREDAWSAAWDLAGHQHLQPLFAHVLSGAGLADCLPAGLRSDLRATRVETAIQNLAAKTELAAIGSRLNERAIPAVPLKGVALAERLFGGLDARQCGDIDILVREEDWSAAYEVLAEYGYQPITTQRLGVQRHPFHGLPLRRTAGSSRFVVELHHHLSDPRFVNIDHCGLWNRVLASGRREDGLYPMPAEELLVFLSFHLPKHDSGLLRLVADIDHLVTNEGRAIDWDRVVTLATSWQTEALLYFSLESAVTLLGTPIPFPVRQLLRPSWWRRVVVPALAGPDAMLRPPGANHIRASRFRIAYCLMLPSLSTMLRSYWQFIHASPGHEPERIVTSLVLPIHNMLHGMARTMLAFSSAILDCRPRWTRQHRVQMSRDVKS